MNLALPDGSQATSDLNWKTFIQSIQNGTWNPVSTSTTPPTVSSGSLTYQAYWSTSGQNLINFNIQIIVPSAATLTWPVNGYLQLPKLAGVISSSVSGTVQTALFPVHKVGSAAVAGYVEISQPTNTAILINTGGAFTSTSNLSIQGFYFIGK